MADLDLTLFWTLVPQPECDLHVSCLVVVNAPGCQLGSPLEAPASQGIEELVKGHIVFCLPQEQLH